MTQTADTLAQTARSAAAAIGSASTARKNAALRAFADNLLAAADDIAAANAQDIAAAQAENLDAPLQERLAFTQPQIAAAARGIQQIIAQQDPIGEITDLQSMPSGIQVGKMRVPLGVIFMIYESRPNVTADAAALALKAGNAILLRGGSEARRTNAAIAACLDAALAANHLPGAAQVITNPSRDLLGELLLRDDCIDLVIPRGGRGLIQRVANNARMAVLKHLDGNCHVYIDAAANLNMATAILENSKTRRYGVCNAAESALIHANIAAAALPPIAAALARHQVQLRVCPKTRDILANANTGANITDAQEDDWSQEYLAPIISIKIAQSLDAAIAHINRYGSAHSDAIVTNDLAAAQRFLREVDSSSVLVNAATGFADGGEYGLGAEIGISTGKLHARGPVGALGLTTQKYIVLGDGALRA